MTLARLATLAALAGCGGRAFTGTGTSYYQHTAVLDGSSVRIPFSRNHWREYDTDCGFARIFGMGEHDCVGESSDDHRTEPAGIVVVDVRFGGCSLVPSREKAVDTPVPALPPIQIGDRTFIARGHDVLEQAADGTAIAVHRQPTALTPEIYAGPWLDPTPWQVGETHHDLTLTRAESGLVLIDKDGHATITLDKDVTTIHRLGDTTLIAGEATVIDVATRARARDLGYYIRGVPRVARYMDGWMIESDGFYWSFDSRFMYGTTQQMGTELAPVGIVGTAFVFVRSPYPHAVVTFDAASRTWRDLRYRLCTPYDLIPSQ